MRDAFHPLHPLPFTEELADYLVHRGFHKARADSLPVAVALTIIGNEPNGIKLVENLFPIDSQRDSCPARPSVTWIEIYRPPRPHTPSHARLRLPRSC
jgi:hypothetical protein